MLVLGKGGKARHVPIGKRLHVALGKVRELHPTFVVTYARGRNRYPCHPSFITKVVKRSFERVGLDTDNNPHRLRATFATDCFRAGVNARVVQELLGHASLATTQVYAEVTAADLREGIAKLRR